MSGRLKFTLKEYGIYCAINVEDAWMLISTSIKFSVRLADWHWSRRHKKWNSHHYGSHCQGQAQQGSISLRVVVSLFRYDVYCQGIIIKLREIERQAQNSLLVALSRCEWAMLPTITCVIPIKGSLGGGTRWKSWHFGFDLFIFGYHGEPKDWNWRDTA